LNNVYCLQTSESKIFGFGFRNPNPKNPKIQKSKNQIQKLQKIQKPNPNPNPKNPKTNSKKIQNFWIFWIPKFLKLSFLIKL
jgi:hypothetical protein